MCDRRGPDSHVFKGSSCLLRAVECLSGSKHCYRSRSTAAGHPWPRPAKMVRELQRGEVSRTFHVSGCVQTRGKVHPPFFFFLLIPFLRLNLRASRVPRLTSSSPSPRDQNLPAGEMPVPLPVRPVSPLLAPLGLDEASICAEGSLGSVGWLRSRLGGWGAIKQSRRIGFPGTAGLALPVRPYTPVRPDEPVDSSPPSFTPRRGPHKRHLMVLCVFLGLRIRSAMRGPHPSVAARYLPIIVPWRKDFEGWVGSNGVCVCVRGVPAVCSTSLGVPGRPSP